MRNREDHVNNGGEERELMVETYCLHLLLCSHGTPMNNQATCLSLSITFLHKQIEFVLLQKVIFGASNPFLGYLWLLKSTHDVTRHVLPTTYVHGEE